MEFGSDYDEILTAFAIANVDFLVVGGYAVNFYGYDRVTGDLDIWINPEESNKEKITNALISLHYLNAGDLDISNLDFSIPLCFRLGEESSTVDIFSHAEGIKYYDAVKEKVPFIIDGNTKIYFISLQDLIVNKMQTGRPKDIADIELIDDHLSQ